MKSDLVREWLSCWTSVRKLLFPPELESLPPLPLLTVGQNAEDVVVRGSRGNSSSVGEVVRID